MRQTKRNTSQTGEITVEYALSRSARKTLSVEVTRAGLVLVRAPLRAGKPEIEAFLHAHADWIIDHIEQRKRQAERLPELSEAEITRLKQAAKELLPQRVAYFGEKMGLSPTGIKITSAEKRFGSCSPQNGICFSWRLMRYPQEAIDYVVVHELAHIRHKNHGKAFYACVAEVLPDYKKRKALLD
jgi:predicted metal-dependent hydrolase